MVIKNALIYIFAFLFFILSSTQSLAVSFSAPIIADHTAVDAFAGIPNTAISAASLKRVVLRRASVGGNVSDGLDDLYDGNTRYDRGNWDFQNRGNPGWQEKVDDFVDQTAIQINDFDIFSMKFCWIDPDANWVYYRDRMEELEAQYPTKIFIWWTMPLPTSGDSRRDAFNNLARSYARVHNKALFDIADIESHNPAGGAVTNGGYEALYAAYTTDGGHLNDSGNVSRDRVAKAWWWLMARVSGWGEGGATPTPSVVCLGTDTTINGDDLVVWAKNYSSINNVLKFAALIIHWGESCRR